MNYGPATTYHIEPSSSSPFTLITPIKHLGHKQTSRRPWKWKLKSQEHFQCNVYCQAHLTLETCVIQTFLPRNII